MKKLNLFLVAFFALSLSACSDTVVSPGVDENDENAFTEAEVVPSDFPADLQTTNLILDGTWGSETSNKVLQTASIQVIHNSSDWRTYFVDVYVNGEKAIDNFRYRTATPFLDLPIGLSVAIAPWYSRSVNDAIATFDYNLEENEKYVVVAAGVLRENRYNTNPGDVEVGFNLFPFAPGQTEASNPGNVDLLVFHGSTDAPEVGVDANGGTLIPGFSFGDFVGYASVPAAKYKLDITAGGKTVKTFVADVSGLGGGAATVLASGLLTPPGFRFALIAVLADGTVIKLPEERKRYRRWSRWSRWRR